MTFTHWVFPVCHRFISAYFHRLICETVSFGCWDTVIKWSWGVWSENHLYRITYCYMLYDRTVHCALALFFSHIGPRLLPLPSNLCKSHTYETLVNAIHWIYSSPQEDPCTMGYTFSGIFQQGCSFATIACQCRHCWCVSPEHKYNV